MRASDEERIVKSNPMLDGAESMRWPFGGVATGLHHVHSHLLSFFLLLLVCMYCHPPAAPRLSNSHSCALHRPIQVEMIKEAILTHGQKTFRGSVVVNLDLSMLGMIEERLGIDFSSMEKSERRTFMRQHKIAIVKLLGSEDSIFEQCASDSEDENLGKESEDRAANEVEDDNLSKMSDATGLGHDNTALDLSSSLKSNPEDDNSGGADSPKDDDGSFRKSGDPNAMVAEEGPETLGGPDASSQSVKLRDSDSESKSGENWASPPDSIGDITASPFYEGVLLSWDAPQDNGAPILEYIVRYVAVEHKEEQPEKSPSSPSNRAKSANKPNSSAEDVGTEGGSALDGQEIHEVSVTGEESNDEGPSPAKTGGSEKNEPLPPPPTSLRVVDLKGGYDYIFSIVARNVKGCGKPVFSEQVSPSAVVEAKSKDELPKIFRRFGIDVSKSDHVKQSIDIMWSRYEKNEFYFEVNSKKQLVMHVIRLDIFVHRNSSSSYNDIEVVVETYSQTNDERLREVNEVPHKILPKNEPWQKAIRKIIADLFVVDEDDMKLVSFDQRIEKPTNSDIIPGLKVTQHNLRAFVKVQGLPPTSKFHTLQTVRSSNPTNSSSTIHHYFEWMDIRKYYVQRREAIKSRRRNTNMESVSGMDFSSHIQVDPFGRPLTDEHGYALSSSDPRRILVEQLMQKLYEGCESLFYSVLASTDSTSCLLQVQLFDKAGISQETSLCKIGTAKRIITECITLDKLDSFCPENVPQRSPSKPLIMDSMGGIKLQLSNANWVDSNRLGVSRVELVSMLEDVISWESDNRLQQHRAKIMEGDASTVKTTTSQGTVASEDSSDETESATSCESWEKNVELDDYFTMDRITQGKELRPFGDAMKVIAEVFGEILAQLSMTTATLDESCDLVENYQILHLLNVAIIDNDKGTTLADIRPTEKIFAKLFYEKIVSAQKSPTMVDFYSKAPVVGPTPENFHGNSILLDSNAKLWFAGDTGRFIERGHVLTAMCKFEVLLIVEHLKLPVTIEDINTATSADQLAKWLTVSRDIALAIIISRDRGGAFKDREEIFQRVAATTATAVVREKLIELLLTNKECKKAVESAKKFTSGLMTWRDVRTVERYDEAFEPRVEFVWEMVTMLRRKVLLYVKGRNFNSSHHKMGLLSFFLRSSISLEMSSSQRQCAYNAAIQLSKVLYPNFSNSMSSSRGDTTFWGKSTHTQRALTEEEFQTELVHYKIDCASRFSSVIDSFRHRTLEVMRHNVSLRVLSDVDRDELRIMQGDVNSRRVRDQLYASSQMRHWDSPTRGSSDEAVSLLFKELFPPKNYSVGLPMAANAAKIFIIGPSKSGKSVLCEKLLVRILATKQIKRDYGIVPVLIPITRLLLNYFKELEECGDDGKEGKEEEEQQHKKETTPDEGEKDAECITKARGSAPGDYEGGGEEVKAAGRVAWGGSNNETKDQGNKPDEQGRAATKGSNDGAASSKDDPGKTPDFIDTYFHQECSRFSRRYQALKKLQNDFKLLFIFDGLDEAGAFRERIEQYINEKFRSRNQMVVVTSRQPPFNPGNFSLYNW